jgi:putative FmdB family regulatory protein
MEQTAPRLLKSGNSTFASGQPTSMPTYEYACKNCGETFEVFQSFSDKPLKKHKECGGALQKVFHARGIVFKGGGFYATDSKPSSSSKSETDSSSSSSTSSDFKPAKSEKAKAKATTTSSGGEGA